MTLEGKNAAIKPNLANPNKIWIIPAINTAVRKASNDPSNWICVAITAVKPAAAH